MKFIFSVFILFSIPFTSFAEVKGVLLRESINFKREASDDSGTRSSLDGVYASTSLGYVAGGWFYIGATWNYFREIAETQTPTTSSHYDYTYNEYGPTLGFIGNHLHLLFTYILLADKHWKFTDATSSGNAGRMGTAYMAELGYRFTIGRNFQFGPSVIYETVTYTRCKSSATGATSDCIPDVKNELIKPFLGIAFHFQ